MSILANSNAIESGGYNLERSLRFRASASAYLNRTPSAGNRKTFTFSAWVKRGQLGRVQGVIQGYVDTNNAFRLDFDSNDTLFFGNTVAGVSTVLSTNAVFRDPSAWYHIVMSIDTTQATAANREILYVNGVQQSVTGSYVSQNTDLLFNYAIAHYIGNDNTAGSRTLDGYLTEVNFIDGQALTPSSFGSTNAETGVWQPAKYTGTYGTNGFYLPFTDTSSTTNLVKDSSGNANNWTPNNISLTAGITYDSMTDVPTLTSATAANYCVLNPLNSSSSALTISGGNLNVTSTAGGSGSVGSSIGVSTGKWYWETVVNTASDAGIYGIYDVTGSPHYPGSASNGYGYYGNTGQKVNSGSFTSYGSALSTGNILGCAFDADNGKIWWSINGTWQASGDPVAGTNAAFTGITGTKAPAIGDVSSGSGLNSSFNAGQRPFSYTPPTGFVALNTFNLPTPTIVKGSQYMNAVTYTGTGSSQSLTGVGFQPDLVWIKGRSGATDHGLYDAVRGVQKQLESNTTTDETTETTGLTAFNSNGFTVGALAQLNTSTATYVAWNWKENATAGFDIVTYTGNGSARTISHSLGVAPSMIIVKARTTASTDQGWPVYHAANTSDPKTDYLLLNSTAATADLDTVWNDTAPTSSVFSVGTNANVNANNDTYVAYCWAEIAGFSKFGSYTGNGSTDGPFIATNFAPKYVLIKRTDAAGNWRNHDTSRDTYNVAQSSLYPNLSNAEATGSNEYWDLLSNGFKLRNADSEQNASGGTYIYMAFASNPMKYSLGR